MSGYKFRRLFLPYCLQRLSDGRYIVLNRRYKPLGWQTNEMVDYDSHPSAARIKITAPIAKKLSWKGSDDIESIYLYSGDGSPFADATESRAYAGRLAILGEILVTTPG